MLVILNGHAEPQCHCRLMTSPNKLLNRKATLMQHVTNNLLLVCGRQCLLLLLFTVLHTAGGRLAHRASSPATYLFVVLPDPLSHGVQLEQSVRAFPKPSGYNAVFSPLSARLTGAGHRCRVSRSSGHRRRKKRRQHKTTSPSV